MQGLKKFYKSLMVAAILLLLGIILFNVYLLPKPFLYAGTLEVTKVDISARLAGAITEITLQEGDRVEKGEQVISLDCTDYKIAATLANQNYERYIKLLKPGWTSPETIDKFKKDMQEANTQVGWCTLYSPIQGKVLSRYHEPGEWMSPGTKILTLGNIRDIWAYIYVPQPMIAKLTLGMKLKAYLPELNNRLFEGTIIKINDEAEFTPKNVQTQTERERLIYGVKVSFLGVNTEEILKPGMTVEVKLPN